MFSRALYYPSIDISNEEWLKTAYLFWEEIDTIVPESLAGRSYNNYSTQYLADEGFLRPLIVRPDSALVNGLVDIVKRYASTEEGMTCLGQMTPINCNPYSDVRSEFYLHKEKLPYVVQELVADRIGDDGWVRVSNNFADYYMTLLANTIANKHSYALLTDSREMSSLSSRFKEDYGGRIFFSSGLSSERTIQRMLVSMIIDGIKIDPLTSFEDLRLFKDSHRDELKRFRSGLDEMTNISVPEGISLEGMERLIKEVYENKVVLAIEDLKFSLKGAHINFAQELSSISYSGITTTLLDMTTNLSAPVTLSIGAGVYFVMRCLATYHGKAEIRKKNSMSYLLSINEHL